MKTVIIATKNKGKAKEFESLFSAKGYEVKTLLDVPDAPDVEETGTTFEENAILKAEAIAHQLDHFVIADDSGLIVDALEAVPAYIQRAMLESPRVMKQTRKKSSGSWKACQKRIERRDFIAHWH